MNIVPETYFNGAYLEAYHAAANGDARTVHRLVSTRAVILGASGDQDMTLLALACIRGDRQAIVTLVGAGADPKQVIKGAGSPAVLAVSRHFEQQDLAAIEPLIVAGFDPQTRLDGKPWLFYLVDYRHWRGLDFALTHGGDINAKADWGKTLITYAADREQYGAVKMLLDRGADPAARADNGDTLLLVIDYQITVVSRGSKTWQDLVALRAQVLSRISDPALRRTQFTSEVERRISGSAAII